MEFLDNLVLPQSGSSLNLLHYLLVLAKMVFLIYAGVLFGSTLFSVYFNFAGKRKNSEHHSRLAVDFIDLITSNKLFAFGLGIVPFVGIILIYAQLLNNTGSPVTGYLTISFCVFLLSIIFVYAYKYSLHLRNLFNFLGQKYSPDVKVDQEGDYFIYSLSSKKLNTKIAIWSLIALIISMKIFIGASALAVDSSASKYVNFWSDIIFGFAPIIKFLHFITASFVVTGIAIIVKKYFWDKGSNKIDDDYSKFTWKFGLSVALIFMIVQPIFLVLNLFVTPSDALSVEMFFITLVVLILVIIAVHLLYSMIKQSQLRYLTISFYLALAIFSFIIIKEQAAFNLSNKGNVVVLAANYDDIQQTLLAASGTPTEEISGKEIYEVKCMACHKFDERKVGPPHREVLPKYINDKAALVKFILNPVKVNPEYPAMSKQGLRPKEAKAVVEYMLKEFGPRLNE